MTVWTKFRRRLLGGLAECAVMTVFTACSAGTIWIIGSWVPSAISP